MKQWNDCELPKEAIINNEKINIRTDYRVILDIFKVLNDGELRIEDKVICCIQIFYVEYTKIVDFEEAIKVMFLFINGNRENLDGGNIRLMDWSQDINIIIPPINKELSKDVRELEYLHWWTFLGAFMEIGECTFSTFVSIRNKKAGGKKLEKYEEELYKNNKNIIDLKVSYDKEKQSVINKLKTLCK